MLKPKILLLHNHDNSWTPQALIEAEQNRQLVLEALHKFGYEVMDVKVYDSVTEALCPRQLDPREWIVFNWCEGYADRPWDYDGVTEELDRLGYHYTGAATWSHRVSADKGRVQAVLRAGRVPIPRGRVLQPADDLDWALFPAIVKPINQHGSYGIDRQAVVLDRQQLRQRLEYVMERYRAPALVEEFIDGREFQVSVWGNRPVDVLPEVELVFGNSLSWEERIYTCEMKFDHDGPLHFNAGFVCPSMLTPQLRAKIGRGCRAAYRAMRCRDYARIDLRVRGQRVYVVDVNPNPDINCEALLVIAASVVGLSYEEVVARITEFAVERWRVTQPPAKMKRSQQHEQPALVSKHI
ncbi:D-alanine-D-alanine ligase [Thermoflexales bacterium]|nr:D-alanine-D-alanine ligase [Thermoflexales bacterium]